MRWRWLAFGLGAYAAALVVLVPATLIDDQLQRASHGRLRLAEAHGSLWSGAGWIEIRDAEGKAGVAKRLAWRVRPVSLLRARLVAEVEFDQAGKPFLVTVSLSRLEIANARIDLPAAALGLGMPKLAPLRLTGDVRVEIPRLSVERGRFDGDATLRWRAAGSVLAPVSPLGEYEVRFNAAGPAVLATLSTLEGPLQLEGTGTLSNAAPPSFLVTANVPEQYREQLTPLFQLFAVQRGAGRFELNSNKTAFGP